MKQVIAALNLVLADSMILEKIARALLDIVWCDMRQIPVSIWINKIRSYCYRRLESAPLPALRNLERDLVVDADRLALAALLIVPPIGSWDKFV